MVDLTRFWFFLNNEEKQCLLETKLRSNNILWITSAERLWFGEQARINKIFCNVWSLDKFCLSKRNRHRK